MSKSTATQWESVSSGTDITYLKVSGLPNDEFIGTFTGIMETQFGNTYLFTTPTGDVGINSCGKLDKEMNRL